VSTLERAIVIAAQAHAGQTDKAGAPYILHPLRLMLRLNAVEERMAAILHDVIEDSDMTLSSLRKQGFPEAVLQALDSLTKRPDESYENFVLRAAADPIGRRVKIADLEDNCDLSRIPNPTARDRKRVAKYRRALRAIRNVMAQDGKTPLAPRRKRAVSARRSRHARKAT
jgi:hypothetical protein